MGLILPRHQFQLEQDNWAATPGTTGAGVSITASATTHTKGSWTEVFASTNFEVFAVTLVVGSDTTNNVATTSLIDIGIGANPNETAILRNYQCAGNTNFANNIGGAHSIFLPLHIPKGARVSARMQSNVSSQDAVISMVLHGGADNWPWKSFDFVDSIGSDTATSGGLNHAFGSTGTFSSWTNIGSTLGKDYGAMFPIVGAGVDASHGATGLVGYVEMGISSTLMGRRFFETAPTEHRGFGFPNVPIFGHFNNGEQMMIRGTMNSTADSGLYVTLLAFY